MGFVYVLVDVHEANPEMSSPVIELDIMFAFLFKATITFNLLLVNDRVVQKLP